MNSSAGKISMDHCHFRRRVFLTAAASIMTDVGFDSAEQSTLDVLAEMLQSFIYEVGNSSRTLCEHAGRTEPIPADVILALVNMGFTLGPSDRPFKKQPRALVAPPVPTSQPKQLSILPAGIKQPHPPHIPAHLPPFPDPHAYIRTPTHKQPVTEYEAIREKSAQQKRDLERALNKFECKTGDTDSLFTSADSMFPLIGCRAHQPAYLVALMPKDQIWDWEEQDEEVRRPKPKVAKVVEEDEEDVEDDSALKVEPDPIDNPYLRPVKAPPTKLKIKPIPPPPKP